MQRLTRSGSLLSPSKLSTTQMSVNPKRKGRERQKTPKVKKVNLPHRGFGGNSGKTLKPYVSQLDSIRKLIFFPFLPCLFLHRNRSWALVIVLPPPTYYYINLCLIYYRHASHYEKLVAAAADFTSGRIWPVNFASETGPKFVWEKVIKKNHNRTMTDVVKICSLVPTLPWCS